MPSSLLIPLADWLSPENTHFNIYATDGVVKKEQFGFIPNNFRLKALG